VRRGEAPFEVPIRKDPDWPVAGTDWRFRTSWEKGEKTPDRKTWESVGAEAGVDFGIFLSSDGLQQQHVSVFGHFSSAFADISQELAGLEILK